jgi:hypothetical protein
MADVNLNTPSGALVAVGRLAEEVHA